MKNCLKGAVAFFFLFFLHGISIGTRQQGISYNVDGIKVVIEKGLKHDCPNMRYCLIETQLLELAQMLFSIITFNLML